MIRLSCGLEVFSQNAVCWDRRSGCWIYRTISILFEYVNFYLVNLADNIEGNSYADYQSRD
jgi:hypothetical protein